MTLDMVNNPPHYGEGTYQVINVIEAWELGYRLGNVIKYVARAHRKGKQLEDLKKARWYLDREISRLEETEATPEDTQIKAEDKERTRYVSVYAEPKEDPFRSYGMYAHTDWTVETLASLIATQAGKPAGTYTIAVELSKNHTIVISLRDSATVGWLLQRYPPDKHSYLLQKVLCATTLPL